LVTNFGGRGKGLSGNCNFEDCEEVLFGSLSGEFGWESLVIAKSFAFELLELVLDMTGPDISILGVFSLFVEFLKVFIKPMMVFQYSGLWYKKMHFP